MGTTVKAYLQLSSSATAEIRRFVLPGHISAPRRQDFAEFRQKLEQLFPSLENTKFTVAWRDEEDESITMSSNEELAQALRAFDENNWPILKVYLTPDPTSTPQEIKQTETKIPTTSEPSKRRSISPIRPSRDGRQRPTDETHPNIMCDGCNESVCGPRFKCLDCNDFDLCKKCFMMGIHPDHDMIRIVSPTGLMHTGHWFVPMRHFWHKLARRAAHHQEKTEARQAKQDARHFRKGRCPYQARAGGDSDGSDTTRNETGEVRNENTDFLKRIGETVASFLDPLGIDVLIDVETKDTSKSKSDVLQSKPAEQPTPTRPVASATAPSETDGQTKPLIPESVPIAKPPVLIPAASESPDTDWTMITGCTVDNIMPDGITSPPIDMDISAPSGPFVKAKIPETESPRVVSFSESPRRPTLPAHLPGPGNGGTLYPILREDPTITESLRQMITMGYSNEGGWLSALLKAKNGDIASVLDVLHPQGPL